MDVTGETENLVLALLRDLRKDLAEQRTLSLTTVDAVRRMERRLDERLGALETRVAHVRDDIEPMVKSELMGRLGHFETMVDEKLDVLAARVASLEVAS